MAAKQLLRKGRAHPLESRVLTFTMGASVCKESASSNLPLLYLLLLTGYRLERQRHWVTSKEVLTFPEHLFHR